MPDGDTDPLVAMWVSGRLTGDSIEGGGIFLVQADGGRFELIVPAGVTMPDLPAGAPVVVSGRFGAEVASFRQQGRIFRVEAIRLDEHPPS